MPQQLSIRNNSLLIANILAWVFFLSINTTFYLILSLKNKTWLLDFDVYLKGVIVNIILLFFFFFHRFRLENFKEKDTSELLQHILKIALGSFFASIAFFLSTLLLRNHTLGNHLMYLDAFYSFSIVLLINLLSYSLFIFRILIFRQASKKIIWLWNTFIYVLFASLLLNFFNFPFKSLPYLSILSIFLLISFIFSSHTQWVAYLSAAGKLRNILVLLLILLVIAYFAFLIIFYYQKGMVFFDVGYSVFVAGLLSFVGIYIFISMLVLIFNLPTSAVYKKKIEEILSFQQLTQSLQVGESIEAIYQALLENAINITQAEAGYVLVLENNFILNHQISQEQQKNIDHYLSNKHKEILTLPYRVLSEENIEGFESLMLLNLYEKKGENIARLVLLKKYEEGFNSEHQELLDTFAKQVSISIENYKLLGQVIEKEKLQQELDIAEKVQKSLLPRNLFVGHNIEIYAISESAKSVGGDYYDIFNISPTRSYLIIGDVSGKGTSAAFNMAQMKGIFQSLAHLDMPPAYFLFYANQAVSKCFEKASFITITLLLIDAEKESLSIARAGHCPTLYHKAQTKETFYIQDKGLGLGIIRNKNFKKHICTQEISYQKGDTILLYTDGISEAKNPKDDEYGYDRLKYFLSKHIDLPPAQIQEKLITDVHLFCEGLSPHDDYTSLLIRF